jgi:hypothetical protein
MRSASTRRSGRWGFAKSLRALSWADRLLLRCTSCRGDSPGGGFDGGGGGGGGESSCGDVVLVPAGRLGLSRGTSRLSRSRSSPRMAWSCPLGCAAVTRPPAGTGMGLLCYGLPVTVPLCQVASSMDTINEKTADDKTTHKSLTCASSY